MKGSEKRFDPFERVAPLLQYWLAFVLQAFTTLLTK
jgi:hypothetical protein